MKSNVTKQWNESDLCENNEDTYDPSAETGYRYTGTFTPPDSNRNKNTSIPR
jgi:hypothetical protein